MKIDLHKTFFVLFESFVVNQKSKNISIKHFRPNDPPSSIQCSIKLILVEPRTITQIMY